MVVCLRMSAGKCGNGKNLSACNLQSGFRLKSNKKYVNLAIGTGLAYTIVLQVNALGLESIPAPPFMDMPQTAQEMKDKTRNKLNAAEESFLKSDLLRDLKAQSDANKEENMKSIKDKYCKRQAEIGIGDCGGLKFIPGATQSGKQKTPEWLSNLLGVQEEQMMPDMDTYQQQVLKRSQE